LEFQFEGKIGHPGAIEFSQEVVVAPKPTRPTDPERTLPADLGTPKSKKKVGEVPHVIRMVVGVEHPIYRIEAHPRPNQLV
jgi:hypothetical protein